VHEKIYDVFVERLVAHAKAIQLGDPFDESVRCGTVCHTRKASTASLHCGRCKAAVSRRNTAQPCRADHQCVAIGSPPSSVTQRWGRWYQSRSKKRCRRFDSSVRGGSYPSLRTFPFHLTGVCVGICGCGNQRLAISCRCWRQSTVRGSTVRRSSLTVPRRARRRMR
jgi:hypothetical protein